MTTPHEIITLNRSHIVQASDILNRAYHDDLVFTKLFKDQADQFAALGKFWKAMVGYAIRYGKVNSTRMMQGIACWLPPHYTNLTMFRMARAGFGLPYALMTMPSYVRKPAQTLFDYIDVQHGKEQRPHWYLWTIGVAPEYQGQGVGIALMNEQFQHADAEGYGVYLETQTEDNVRYYEKRGFAVTHEGQVTGLDFPVKLWTMWRAPQPVAE